MTSQQESSLSTSQLDIKIVSPETLDEDLEFIKYYNLLSIDTETTGLSVPAGDRLFSIQIHPCAEDTVFYFNFHDYGDGTPVLDRSVIQLIGGAICGKDKTLIAHNMKFDLAMLRAEGLDPQGKLYDTMITERLIDNNLESGSFSLAETSKRYGTYKDDKVKEYIETHELYTEYDIPGVQRKGRDLHFNRVPADLMIPYACQDTTAVTTIMQQQLVKFDKMKATFTGAPIDNVVDNENELVRTVQRMEEIGVLVDRDYCKKAVKYYEDQHQKYLEEFKETVGQEFVDSNNQFMEILAHKKDKWVYGPPSKVDGRVSPRFDWDILQGWSDCPVVAAILSIREAKKNCDYFHSFLYNSRHNGRIHASFNAHQTRTGRFSSSGPNLQNLTKGSAGDFPVRRALIPDPGFSLFSLDYDQVEYRMALDYAGAMGLISKIVNGGLDVHAATATAACISRDVAKSVNFAILYGAGDKRLADNLKISYEEAKRLRRTIMGAVPELDTFIRNVMRAVDTRGYLHTWLGRILQFPLVYDNRWKKHTRNSYRGINYLIQGGCADLMKKAMNRIHSHLRTNYFGTDMLMTVHDELIFRVRNGYEEHIKWIKDIMETTYPYRHIPLTTGVEYSTKSLADLEPWTM